MFLALCSNDKVRVAHIDTENAKSKAINWLETVDTRCNYILAQQKRHVTTGTWFLEGKAFHAWRDSPGSLLWLHGIRKWFTGP